MHAGQDPRAPPEPPWNFDLGAISDVMTRPTFFAPNPFSHPAYPGMPLTQPAYPGMPLTQPTYPGMPLAQPTYPGMPLAHPGYPGMGTPPLQKSPLPLALRNP